MNASTPFNPLDKVNLGKSVAEALLESKVHPLGGMKPFLGAGIYAIYYVGNYKAYAPIAEANRDNKFAAPIYVGKAVPAGARRGGALNVAPGRVLFNRLAEHAESIDNVASSLSRNDFFCRYLVVDDIWIPLGESLLIAKFAPLWNRFVDGFGNHDPGSGRYAGMRPRWDVLHPGRGWAEKCAPRIETKEQIEADVSSHLASTPLPIKPMIFGDEED